MSDTETGTVTEQTSPTLYLPGVPRKLSKAMKSIRPFGWIFFGLMCFLVFTFFKIHEVRLKNFIHGQMIAGLNAQGIAFTAAQTSLSIGWGVTYRMKDVSVSRSTSEGITQIDEIKLTPSIIPLVFGTLGGRVHLRVGAGELGGHVAVKNFRTHPIINLKLQLKKLDSGRLGLTDTKHSVLLNGNAFLSGDIEAPDTWVGDGHFKIEKLIIQQQSIMGFQVPQLNISEGEVEFNLGNGKGVIKTFKLGKRGDESGDDIIGSVSGDLVLAKTLDGSTMTLKTNFSLSQSVLKSFVLLDALMGSAKQSDGSYSYDLTGQLTAPTPVAAGGGGGGQAGSSDTQSPAPEALKPPVSEVQ